VQRARGGRISLCPLDSVPAGGVFLLFANLCVRGALCLSARRGITRSERDREAPAAGPQKRERGAIKSAAGYSGRALASRTDSSRNSSAFVAFFVSSCILSRSNLIAL
jgi:hypothetical protein